MSRATFLDDIAMSLGGYVAEKEIFGDITTGPSNDLEVASKMARQMVMRYGMSTLGPIAFDARNETLLGTKEYSEEYAQKIDDEVKRIMDEAWNRARLIITDKRHVLTAIAEELMRGENNYELMIEQMKSKGLDPEHPGFAHYLLAFKHGLPEHGGCGFGIDRFVEKIIGLANIKEAILFPRDINRLAP
jgi:cell division protease FtsH